MEQAAHEHRRQIGQDQNTMGRSVCLAAVLGHLDLGSAMQDGTVRIGGGQNR